MEEIQSRGSRVEPGAERELHGLTAGVERDALRWLAARTPSWVGPDHLTLIGAAGLGLAGAAYAASGRWPWLLLVVNLGLVVNWLGDSLDGTVARYRRRTRPRYGHYVDHVVDALGAVALLGGLGASGWIGAPVAFALLTVYLLFLVHMGFAARTTGRCTMSYSGVGGTELRLGLAAVNTIVLWQPRVVLGETPVLVLDLVGSAALVGMALLLVRAVCATALELDQADRARC